MTELTLELAERAVGLSFDDLPDDVVAMAALGRSTMVIDDTVAGDAAVIALRDRVTVIDDGASGAPTLVGVILNDGRRLSTAQDVNAPEHDLTLQRRRLEQKFRTITAGHLGAERAKAIIAAVQTPPAAFEVSAIIRLTRQ